MVIVKLLVEGGNMKPGPAIAQQLGPMGINIGQVISDVNDKTQGFTGINVPVVLNVDGKTKEYVITVMSPPTSELLKKELGISKASGNRLKVKVGNLAFERVIFVALQKHDNMLSNEFLSSVKSVLGTCQSMGILVDNKEIKEIMDDFEDGKYDAMIKAKNVDVNEGKVSELKDYFAIIDAKQAAEKEAAEAAEKANK